MKKHTVPIVRICLIAAGTAAIITGIVRAEPAAVWMKGVMICLDCIGIG